MLFSKVLRTRQALLLAVAAMTFTTGELSGSEPSSPTPQQLLRPLLRIDWARGPNLPQGYQDSDGGFLGATLITCGGFCSGGLDEDNRRKPGTYPRGFLKKTWGLDVGARNTTWTSLPDFPGEARQGLFSAVVGSSMYLWGGFSYSEPFCYADGWRLERDGGFWAWHLLPSLPWKLTSSGLCVIGSQIFAVGGADYDGVTGFFTENDRENRNPRLGARLLVFDTADPKAGWQKLPDCPGTPRFVHAVQAVNGRVFVIGGATGDLKRDGKSYGYCTVVDNWMYDPSSRKWSRLRDLPVSSGNFPKSSNLVYRNRYVILPGGHQYAYVANPDGTVRSKYGTASQHRPESGLHNDVFVYDTETDRFGTADKLPIDNNLPMTVVRDDKIYLLGGETGGGIVGGEYYGHHPDLLLIGTIRTED
ncbi:MAG: Kelch repeat-containing protein [Planctomycetaceae bacterium]